MISIVGPPSQTVWLLAVDTSRFFLILIEKRLTTFTINKCIILDDNAKLGGVSRRVGGRDERPPQSLTTSSSSQLNSSSPSSTQDNSPERTTAALNNANNINNNNNNTKKWVPLSIHNNPHPHQQHHYGFLSTSEHHDNIFRKVRGILNKLTPEKFDKLSLELLNVGIDSQTVLKGIIFLIIQKALNEPKYSSLYARLCQRLCDDAPNFEQSNSNISTFRKLLLNKCQDEFENRSKATEAFEKDGHLTPEEMEQHAIAKAKMLGNIKFIGELGKLEMVHEGIIHECIRQLVARKKRIDPCPNSSSSAEDLECLCQILRTVGKRLDHDKAQAWMDQYFERIHTIQSSHALPPRIRFMLQDLIELRANKWLPRKAVLAEGAPRTIQQVREESGVFHPNKSMTHPNLSPTYLLSDPFFSMAPHQGKNNNGDPFGFGSTGWFGGGGFNHLGSRGGRGGGMHNKNARGGSRGGNQANSDGMFGHSGYQNNNSYNQRGGYHHQPMQKSYDDNPRHHQSSSYGNSVDSNGTDDQHYNNQGFARGFRNKEEFLASRSGEERGGGFGKSGESRRGGSGGSVIGNSAAGQSANNRELPPRFRKQQQQTKDSDKGEDFQRMAPSPEERPTKHGHQFHPPSMAVRPNQMQSGFYPPSLQMPPNFQHPPMMHHPNGQPMMPPQSQMAGGGTYPSAGFGRPMPPFIRPPALNNAQSDAEISLRPTNTFAMPKFLPENRGPLNNQQLPTMFPKQSLDLKVTDNTLKAKTKHTSKQQEAKQSWAEVKSLIDAEKMEEAVIAIQGQLKNAKYISDLLTNLMLQALEQSDADRDKVGLLIRALKLKDLLNSDQFMKSFKVLLDRLIILEQDLPCAKSHLAKLAAQAVSCDAVSLVDLAAPMTSGSHYPLFLLCLQQLVKLESAEWLAGRFDASKINLRTMLPVEMEKGDKLMEVLEERELSFLLPLQRVQGDLWKQLTSDPEQTAISYFKWIKDNVDPKLHSDLSFVSMLVTTIVKYVTSQTTLKEGVDISVAPDKQAIQKERQLLEKYKGVLQKFLQDKIELHVSAIYALQVFSHSQNSPKGLLLRLFSNFYDFEIIYEEAFLRWKEEVNDLQPGKGQALFQVNQWLVWLEQADDDSEEED